MLTFILYFCHVQWSMSGSNTWWPVKHLRFRNLYAFSHPLQVSCMSQPWPEWDLPSNSCCLYYVPKPPNTKCRTTGYESPENCLFECSETCVWDSLLRSPDTFRGWFTSSTPAYGVGSSLAWYHGARRWQGGLEGVQACNPDSWTEEQGTFFISLNMSNTKPIATRALRKVNGSWKNTEELCPGQALEEGMLGGFSRQV